VRVWRFLLSRSLAVIATVALAAGALTMGAVPAGSAAAPSPRCHTSDLKISDQGSSAGLGTVFQSLRLTNVSGHVCHVRGYPGLRLISRRGNALPTHVTREGVAHRVTLRANHAARFAFSFHVVDLPRGGVPCHSHRAYKVRVIPPDETAALVLTLRRSIKPCHGDVREQALSR
jgi:Domain of unknown function (DUF4232)